MFIQNIMKLSAGVHELSCLKHFASSRSGKESENPVL